MGEHPDAQTLALIRAAQTVRGVPPEQHNLPFANIRQLLSLHAKVSPEKVFLIHYDGEGRREAWTYAAFNARVHQAAGFLHDDLGVRRGDRVATIAHNHADTVILYFACWLIGAAVAPQNVTEDDQRIAFILRNSEAVVCFVRAEYLERAERIVYSSEAGLGAPNIRQMVVMGGSGGGRWLEFEAEVAHRPNTFVSAAERPTLDDEALLVYTSGTTGAPKGVVLTQMQLLIDAQGIAAWHALTGNQRMMCVLPIHHVNGIVVTLITPLLAGASVVLNRAFSVSHFWERVARERVQIVSVVPTLLQFLLDYAQSQIEKGESIYGQGVSTADLTHFRHLICGAGDAVDGAGAGVRRSLRRADPARLRAERDDLLLVLPARDADGGRAASLAVRLRLSEHRLPDCAQRDGDLRSAGRRARACARRAGRNLHPGA
jgi:long-chain acyl-CoA synthetase